MEDREGKVGNQGDHHHHLEEGDHHHHLEEGDRHHHLEGEDHHHHLEEGDHHRRLEGEEAEVEAEVCLEAPRGRVLIPTAAEVEAEAEVRPNRILRTIAAFQGDEVQLLVDITRYFLNRLTNESMLHGSFFFSGGASLPSIKVLLDFGKVRFLGQTDNSTLDISA